MKYEDCQVCMGCMEVFVPRAGEPNCQACGGDEVRPLRRALLEGRKLDELPDLLTEEEFAWWLGVALVTLQGWRYEGMVPSFVRIGRPKQGPVRYGHADIRAFIESRRQNVAVQKGA